MNTQQLAFRPGLLTALVSVALISSAAPAQVWLYSFAGDSTGDHLGFAVSGVGDVDGDGHDDVIVGARQESPGPGFARLHSGADGSVLYTWVGDSPGIDFGYSVSGAGDVDGDGVADVIVGARFDHPNGSGSGSASVFSGHDGSLLHRFDGDALADTFGVSVSGAGDVNGDGFDDLIVGANLGSSTIGPGYARVYSGLDGDSLHTFSGDADHDNFGYSVSGAGDVDGDGFHDVIVGAHQSFYGPGYARIFSGANGSALYTFSGVAVGDLFGFSVSGAGDVNGDGFHDVIVGKPQIPNEPGSAHVFSGVDGSALHVLQGESEQDQFGVSVGAAGDANGDGFDDLIVGARLASPNGSSSGSAYVISGFDGATLQVLHGDTQGDTFGWSVASAGDMNADGLPDLVVGAPGDDPAGLSSGSARIFLGLPGGCANTPASQDFNGNGIPDQCESCQIDLGFGGPGSMFLAMCGDDLTGPNSVAGLTLVSAAPDSPVFLFVGMAYAPTPVKGGMLVPFPWDVLIDTLSTDSAGQMSFAVPGGSGPPLTIYFQAVVHSDGVFEFSNALEVLLGTRRLSRIAPAARLHS